MPSLLSGIGCLLMAFFLLYPRHHSNSPVRAVLSLTAVIFYGLVVLRQRQILDWLKARITYPRAGYVSPPYFSQDTERSRDVPVLRLFPADLSQQEEAMRVEADRRNRIWVTLALTLVTALAIMFIRSTWVCAAAGLLMAAAIWLGARHEQRLSWIILGGFPLVGFWMAIFLGRDTVGPERIAYLLAGGGLLFFLDGALSLVHFLRRNPRPASTVP